MNMKKILALALCLVLVAGLSIGGTIAWITASTTKITNTFTVGDINITLAETTGDSYQMVPGRVLDKNPKVTVAQGSEACWLFVKVEKTNNPDTYLTYAIADGWTALKDEDGVYYREVAATTTAAAEFAVIAGDQVTVKDTVTKDMLNTAKTAAPTLAFTAYAVQKEGISTAADAWAKLGV